MKKPKKSRPGRRATPQHNLQVKYPNVAAEFRTDGANGDLTPLVVSPYSTFGAAWRCETCGQEWTSRVVQRTHKGQGCPRCEADRQRANSLAAKSPEVAAQLDSIRNPPGIDPWKIAWSSNTPLWWKCTANGAPDHEWQESPNRRLSKGRRKDGGPGGCPFCQNVRVSVTNSLATVRPDLAAQWDPEKNGGLTPADVTFRSTQVAWWLDEAGNSWPAQIRWRTTQKGRNPFDTGHRLAPERSLAAVRPDLAAEWAHDLNGGVTPEQVAARSARKYMWRKDGLVWPATVADRVRGRGSPFVHGHKVSPTNSLLAVAPQLAKEWSPHNDKSAAEITAFSSQVALWICRSCQHEWPASPKNRLAGGTGCPQCHPAGLSRAQHRILWELRYCFPDVPLRRVRLACERLPVEGQRTRREREVDILLPSLSVAVEYDGVFWHGSDRRVADDRRKNTELQQAGLRVLRVREAGLPLLSDDDIVVEPDAGNRKPHLVAAAVLGRLLEWGHVVERASAYLAEGQPLMAEQESAAWQAHKDAAGQRKKHG